eukprot:gene423-1059_t
MELDKATVGLGFKVLSTVTSGIFAGGALYINLVEHPARMEAPDMAAAVTMWKPSFVRAASIWSKFAMTSSISSFAAYFLTKGEAKENIGWLATGGLMISIPILTGLIIIPINNQLLETDNCIKEKGDEWIEEHLNAWNRRHSYRTMLGLGAFAADWCTRSLAFPALVNIFYQIWIHRTMFAVHYMGNCAGINASTRVEFRLSVFSRRERSNHRKSSKQEGQRRSLTARRSKKKCQAQSCCVQRKWRQLIPKHKHQGLTKSYREWKCKETLSNVGSGKKIVLKEALK